MPSSTLRGQEGHCPRYISRCTPILTSDTRDSVDPSLGIETLDFVSYSAEETVVKAGLFSCERRTDLGFCQNDSWAFKLSARSLLVLSHASQEMLDSEKRSPNVCPIAPLPFVHWQIPDGTMVSLILQAGVDN